VAIHQNSFSSYPQLLLSNARTGSNWSGARRSGRPTRFCAPVGDLLTYVYSYILVRLNPGTGSHPCGLRPINPLADSNCICLFIARDCRKSSMQRYTRRYHCARLSWIPTSWGKSQSVRPAGGRGWLQVGWAGARDAGQEVGRAGKKKERKGSGPGWVSARKGFGVLNNLLYFSWFNSN
jgi:hypothetical protein